MPRKRRAADDGLAPGLADGVHRDERHLLTTSHRGAFLFVTTVTREE
jgi:hypothetical protein